jgi:hypothetical protein
LGSGRENFGTELVNQLNLLQYLSKNAKICNYSLKIENMQKYVICSKTSKYARICNIIFGFWGPHNLIRKDPEFQVPITFQIEYASMQNSGL